MSSDRILPAEYATDPWQRREPEPFQRRPESQARRREEGVRDHFPLETTHRDRRRQPVRNL